VKETDNLVHFSCQAIGKEMANGIGKGMEMEMERNEDEDLDEAGILRWN